MQKEIALTLNTSKINKDERIERLTDQTRMTKTVKYSNNPMIPHEPLKCAVTILIWLILAQVTHPSEITFLLSLVHE